MEEFKMILIQCYKIYCIKKGKITQPKMKTKDESNFYYDSETQAKEALKEYVQQYPNDYLILPIWKVE
jgi:hypothetical protein